MNQPFNTTGQQQRQQIPQGQAHALQNDEGCFFGSWFRFPPTGNTTTAAAADADAAADQDPTSVIAQTMHTLSLQEREQVYEDVHGVSVNIYETSQLIQQSFIKMEQQLQTLTTKHAYNLAERMNTEYVHDNTLRLLFLRADKFDIPKACIRFIGWFQWKLQLFGIDKLCQKQITLQDLNDDTQYMIESGRLQVLPSRDSRGRAVCIAASSHHKRLFRSTQSALQMMWYILSSVVEDEVTQKQGAVLIICLLWSEQDISPSSSSSLSSSEDHRGFFWSSPQLTSVLPIRWEAMHVLLPTISGPFQLAMTGILNSAGRYLRARFRIHRGTYMECEYSLLTYGLPSSLLPYSSDGILKTSNHKKWYQRRRIKEEEERHHHQAAAALLTTGGGGNNNGTCSTMIVQPFIFTGIDLPSQTDVLLGKGKPIQVNAGNQIFQEVMQQYEEEYTLASRNGGKAIVARKIIEQITNPLSHQPQQGEEIEDDATTSSSDPMSTTTTYALPGRFLRRRKEDSTGGWWEEVVDEETLIERVCNGFRNMRAGHKISNSRMTGTAGTTTMSTKKMMTKSTSTTSSSSSASSSSNVSGGAATTQPSSTRMKPNYSMFDPNSQATTTTNNTGSRSGKMSSSSSSSSRLSTIHGNSTTDESTSSSSARFDGGGSSGNSGSSKRLRVSSPTDESSSFSSNNTTPSNQ